MDHQYRSSLIRQDVSGTYCLGFLNSYGLDIEEIGTIFSAFGEVLNIKETGDKKGYRFVRYQYADEAENAVDGLKTHPKIRIVEHRPKSNKKSENNRNEKKIQNGNGNKNENKNKNFNGNRNENKYQNGNGYNKKNNQNCNGNFKEENQISNENNKETCQNSGEIYKEENQNDKRIYAENQVNNNQKSGHSSIKGNSNNTNVVYSGKSCNSLNSMPDNGIIKRDANSLTSSLSNESLYLEDDCGRLDIPDLVKGEKLKIINNAPKKTILNAEEVIVGNIPNDFGSPFILHLFERYQPIAITDINFVKNSTIRYCHVYFKTLQDSLDVEKTFDRMNLSGQKLLVLRPCQLIQEAIC